MKRRVMTMDEIRKESWQYYLLSEDELNDLGIFALVEVENMGWCRDGVTRWYTFHDENGEPAIYYKH